MHLWSHVITTSRVSLFTTLAPTAFVAIRCKCGVRKLVRIEVIGRLSEAIPEADVRKVVRLISKLVNGASFLTWPDVAYFIGGLEFRGASGSSRIWRGPVRLRSAEMSTYMACSISSAVVSSASVPMM